MYQGYFCMGGTEIINNPRTAGYARTASQLQDLSIPLPPKEPDQVLATNAFTNPSFKGDGTRVTVYENLITNPSFETAQSGSTTVPAQTIYRNDLNAPVTTGWVASLVAANGSGATGASTVLSGAAGSRVIRVQTDGATTSVNPTASVRMTLTLTTVVGVQYTVTYQYKSVSSACVARVSLGTVQGPETSSNVLAAGSPVVFTATATTTNLVFDVYDNSGSTATRDSVYGELGDVTVTQASYVVPTAPIEVRRNWALNPRQVSGGSATEAQGRYSGQFATSFVSGTGGHPALITTAARLTCTADTSGAGRGFDWYGNADIATPLAAWTTAPTVTAGATVTIRVWGRSNRSIPSMAIGIRFYDGTALTWTSSFIIGATVSSVGGQWSLLTVTAVAPAGSTRFVVRGVNNSATFSYLTGDTIDQSGLYIGINDAGSYFDGISQMVPDPDLANTWSATANASPSVLNGIGVAGVSNSGQNRSVSVRSTQWSNMGSRSVRVIPKVDAAAGSYAEVAVPGLLAGQVYTIIGFIRLVAPQTGVLHAMARAFWPIGGGDPVVTYSKTAPNQAGVFEVRGTFVAGAGTSAIRFMNGARMGGGDVWWDSAAVVRGAYVGPYFDGSHPLADEDFQTAWVGASDASISRITGEGVAGVIASGSTIIHSEQYGGSVRVISSGLAGEIGCIIGLAVSAGSTVIATAHRKVHSSVPYAYYPSLTDGTANPSATDKVPDDPGDYDLRITTFTGYGDPVYMTSSLTPGADIWYSHFGMFEGEYNGAWFSGDSVPQSDNVQYRWMGEPNASPSEMILLSPEPQATYYCNINSFKLDECTTLRDALGDDVAYEAGNISEAPWYSMNNIFQGAENPSRKFLGAYAAEVSSLSDSPTIAGMTEGITDGGIIGRARRAIPTFRFRVVLLAVDEEGLEYGTTWLNSAISDAVCATHGPSCGSVDLTFLVDCPPERRDDETDEEYETRLDSITRVYHDVKRINGPVVVEEKRRREKNIYQRIVEFTLAAGVPSMFGPASITSVVPPEGERIVSDVAQNLIPFPSSELAMPDPILIGVNQSLNPSVETNATGWSAGAVAVSGAGPSTYLTSGRTTETAIVGLASFRARILGNSTTEASGVGDVRIMHTVAGVNVTNPEQLPISLSMWASAGIFAGAAASAIQSIRVDAVWLDAGNATISTLVMGTETSDFTGRTYSVKNVMPPATATSVRFEVHAIVTWASSATAANNSDIRLFADAAAVITPI